MFEIPLNNEFNDFDNGDVHADIFQTKNAYNAYYSMDMDNISSINNCREYCGIGKFCNNLYLKYYDNINYKGTFYNEDEEISTLKEDLKKQEAETQEYVSLSQRLQADFENFKKITDKRNVEIVKFANENLIKEFLDCYEDLQRSLTIEKDEDFREGVELIYNKFSDILTKEGVEEIPAKGEKFDLNKHEALMVQESEDVENGYIIEELMKGYMYKDKVLKYSKVIVCKK